MQEIVYLIAWKFADTVEGMKSETILVPLLAQVFLTAIIWTRLLYGRISTHLTKRIDPQVAADDTEARKVYREWENTSDNLENLFEMPILFYVAIILIFIMKVNNLGMTLLAWIFVLFRVLHSWIHITSNRIFQRFQFYVISSLALWLIWIRLAILVATN